MLSNIKQGIGNTLTRFRKAINPIRWLGYVRPNEVTIGTTTDLADRYVTATHDISILQRRNEQLSLLNDTLEETVLNLRERMADCDCDEVDDDN